MVFSTFPSTGTARCSRAFAGSWVILLCLLMRGVAFEFRNQVDQQRWQDFWDWMVPRQLDHRPSSGVSMAKLIEGYSLNANRAPIGGFGEATPFSVLGGVATLLLFMLHGANFLLLRLHEDTELYARARTAALRWCARPRSRSSRSWSWATSWRVVRASGCCRVFPVAAAAALVSIWFALVTGRDKLAFTMSGLEIVFSTVTIFIALYTPAASSCRRRSTGVQPDARGSASQQYTTGAPDLGRCDLPAVDHRIPDLELLRLPRTHPPGRGAR